MNAADIEMDVKRRFGIDVTGKLAELQRSIAEKGPVLSALQVQKNAVESEHASDSGVLKDTITG